MFSRAKDCHADLHGDSKMEEFKELSHAYSVLSDPAQRSRYDSMSSTDQRGRSGESMNHDQSQVAASMPAVCLISTSVSTCSEMWQWVRRRPLLSTCKNSKAIAKRHWQNQKKKKSPAPYAVLAKKRWVELALLVVPGLFFARFPGLFMAGLRVAGTAGAFLGSVLLRNDWIRRIMTMSVYRRVVRGPCPYCAT